MFCHCYFLRRSRDFSPSCCDTANNFLLCFSLPGISRNPAHELSVEKKNMYYTHTSHVSKRLKYENWRFSRTTTVGIKNCRNCIEQPINVPLSQCSHSLNPCNARRTVFNCKQCDYAKMPRCILERRVACLREKGSLMPRHLRQSGKEASYLTREVSNDTLFAV